MPAKLATLAAFAALGACASTPSPLSEDRAPKSPLATRVEGQLGAIAKFQGKGKGSVVLAPGKDEVRERSAVAFSFQVVSPRPETGLRDAALLAATVDADGRGLVVAVRPTSAKVKVTEETEGGDHEATYDKVQILLARKREEAGSHDARLHVARVFGLDGGKLDGAYAAATLSAFVLGTKLVRTASPPSFRAPGEGSWTLLRIVSPGEGYLAIDWDAGRGEIFPKNVSGEGPSDLATAILRVM